MIYLPLQDCGINACGFIIAGQKPADAAATGHFLQGLQSSALRDKKQAFIRERVPLTMAPDG